MHWSFFFFFFAVCVTHTILVPCVCACVINCFSHVQFCNPLNCGLPGPLSMGFSRQEYQMGCQFLLQGIFPGIKPAFLMSLALVGRFFTPFNGTPLQYSFLANPMDGGAWNAAVHGVAKSQTQLSNFTFPFHFHALEKEMATHSSVLAWRILGTGEPGGLPSLGLHRVGHDWSDLAAAAAVIINYRKGGVCIFENHLRT